jgi:integrase/recombinase XerD
VKNLRTSVQDYIAMRRALGFKLVKYDDRLLDFVTFLKRQGSTYITVKQALEWVAQTPSTDPNYRADRLGVVRGFARYRSAIDPRTQIPGADLLPRNTPRLQPHLYTPEEVRRLLLMILQPRRAATPISRWSRYAILGLLSVTGLRISEALNLNLKDVDLDQGILTIRHSKWGKDRLVPIHPSTRAALSEYLRRRNECFAGRSIVPFFVSRYGARMTHSNLHRTFMIVSRKLGLRGPCARRGPRLHDFRHRMAVLTLLRCYASGADPQRRLPALSTFLGHTRLAHTYWYLHQHPELMQHAVHRLEKHWRGRV